MERELDSCIELVLFQKLPGRLMQGEPRSLQCPLATVKLMKSLEPCCIFRCPAGGHLLLQEGEFLKKQLLILPCHSTDSVDRV